MREIFRSFTWAMAWRDARRSLPRLLSSAFTVALGIAALVAVGSLSKDVSVAVRSESKGLLGADLAIRSRAPLKAEAQLAIAKQLGTPEAESRQVAFTSIASFPKTGAVRQARVRGLEGDFPYYGTLETDPPDALTTFRGGGHALVDRALFEFGGVGIGDKIRIGEREYAIAGALLKAPGESATSALFGAPVYVQLAELDEKLFQRGSRVDYATFVKLRGDQDSEAIRNALNDPARDFDFSISTARSAEQNWARTADRLHDFLHLAALAALLLGGLGVGSAMQLHARQKREVVATLRCVGARSEQAFAIFAVQALWLGLLGTAFGSFLGIATAKLIPRLFADFLPVTLSAEISWASLALGAAVGIGFTLLAALWPLTQLRSVPALLALRASTEPPPARRFAGALFVLGLLSAIALYGAIETGRGRDAVEYAVAIGIAIGVLGIAAQVVMFVTRKIVAPSLPFAWRFGLANLHRPDNQTPVLMLTLGAGAFLLATIDQTEAQIYGTVARATEGLQPNLVLFDVQKDEVDDIKRRIEGKQLPVLDDVPVVTMRIEKLKGRTVEELRNDRSLRFGRWALTREYRSTYRTALSESESTLEGEWKAEPLPDGRFPVSLDRGITDDLDVKLGDSITWDVAGLPVETVVTHIRQVEWQRLKPNFFALFSPQALADAPQFRILSTRAEDPNVLGELQRDLAQSHPGISAIDLGLILSVAGELFDRVGLVLRAMGGLCLGSGILVLLGAWLGSRRQRLEESALLRAIGASRGVVQKIATVEAAAIGFLAATTGAALAIGASYLLTRYRFDIAFTLATSRLAVLTFGLALLSVVIAALASRGLHRAPPLAILRED